MNTTIPPNYRLKASDKTMPKFQAFRCRTCGRDIDTSLNPIPKRACAYCGCGHWRNVTTLTLQESFRIYSQTGVVFLNEDKPEHAKLKLWLQNHPRCVRWLEKKQAKGSLSKGPYSWIGKILKDV